MTRAKIGATSSKCVFLLVVRSTYPRFAVHA
jgi:epsin